MNFLFRKEQKIIVFFNREETFERNKLVHILYKSYVYKSIHYIFEKNDVLLLLDKVKDNDYLFLWCHQKEKMDWIYSIIHTPKKLNIFLLLDFIPQDKFLSCCLSNPFQPFLLYNFHVFQSNIVSFYNSTFIPPENHFILKLFLNFLEKERERIYSREILFQSSKRIKQPVQLQFHYSSNHLENFRL